MRAKRIIQKLLRTLYNQYKKKPRSYAYKNLKLQVLPEVFHPGFFFSTKYLLEFFYNHHEVVGKKILELGAGSGLISIFLAQKGGEVYASDINPKAIENVRLNAKLNDQTVSLFNSDLFDNIPVMSFDHVLINPPYYPKDPTNDEEKAWYCGEGFEYFQKLFTQLKDYVHSGSIILMVLSEDCDLKRIDELASGSGWHMSKEDSKQFVGESSIIYRLSKET